MNNIFSSSKGDIVGKGGYGVENMTMVLVFNNGKERRYNNVIYLHESRSLLTFRQQTRAGIREFKKLSKDYREVYTTECLFKPLST